MIRDGKLAGWLQLPADPFKTWAVSNDVEFHRTGPGSLPGRGGALLAKEPLNADQDTSNVLLTVPKDLILSLEQCQEHAKVDQDYRELLTSLGDFGRTPRGAILSFLLVQASMLCPSVPDRVSVRTPFLEYIKSLPLESLPTTWSPEELQLLVGTTLAPAISSKLKSLRREYDGLCSKAANTRWFQIVGDLLDFDDWVQVDSMYRSRALEYPSIGHCMVPCVDLANHASRDATVAVYEKDDEGNAVLLLRDGKKVDADGEVTITYGDEKGACEMIFSYGFLEENMQTAESLFLSLTIPDDDPLQEIKIEFADVAPGFKLIDAGNGEIDWSGNFIWLLCANDEDGLHFEVARTVDGKTEVDAFFGDRRITMGATCLRRLLTQSGLWDVYRLRAITLLQQRVFDQLQVLYTTQEDMESMPHGDGTEIRDRPFELVMELRRLEFDLMNTAYEAFEQQKNQLAQSSVVIDYLRTINEDLPTTSSREPQAGANEQGSADDFS